ncbi:hypothetical protein [Pontibacter sp. SGAir0037]|uniref:hypothetical protein n=1 Tax=Pontibacter sp. SGAir0037 TaxID=2571030 RepID=UPI0010CD416B|nr:hypothetical protein [Pontibacter sp. SGAir0037]QCR21101.1 hypothetical protein C1N53_01120 [Pontibacter sp. SGAir0037]
MDAEETLEPSSEEVSDAARDLEVSAALLPKGLKKKNVLFMGPVVDGFFQPEKDKLHDPPRWEPGNYSLAAGKWPPPSLVPNFIDLTSYNGYVLMVMASEWDKEVISEARIFGVLDAGSGDVVGKFVYKNLQEKEEEIAAYISGISN